MTCPADRPEGKSRAGGRWLADGDESNAGGRAQDYNAGVPGSVRRADYRRPVSLSVCLPIPPVGCPPGSILKEPWLRGLRCPRRG